MSYILLVLLVLGQLENSDFLDSLLNNLKLSYSDFGYKLDNVWPRIPSPSSIPYTIKGFDHLIQHPFDIPLFAKTLSNIVERYGDTSYVKHNNDELYQLFYFLGVDRQITGFRNYGANIYWKRKDGISLKEAYYLFLSEMDGQLNQISFGGKYDSTLIPDIDQEFNKIPESLKILLANYFVNLQDALHWWNIAMRNVNREWIIRAYSHSRSLIESQSSGNIYYPEYEDLMNSVDWHSFYYASLKLAQASLILAKKIDSLPLKEREFKNINVDISTPLGRIIILGTEDNSINVTNSLLVLDLGGNDEYHGGAGATSYPGMPFSILIDIQGNDYYMAEGDNISQGAAICGTGILIDLEGDDKYEGADIAQGASIAGTGILYDIEGNDSYRTHELAQGASFFGIGMLADINGDDNFYILGNGQGDGELGGVGALLNVYGNDHYTAEPWSDVYNRGDYHSKYKVNASNAQGFGGGRRGDGSDGHSYAGGLGMLIDIHGDDEYLSGNWSLGTGYWFGMGIFYDKDGNDTYSSCYFTQASGAHFAIGAFFDEAGNDKHKLFETKGAALGFGWDYTIAFFHDGKGDDYYEASIISLGCAEIRSNAFFFDLEGDDSYRVDKKSLYFGASDKRKYYRNMPELNPFIYYSNNIGIFVDGDGVDEYIFPEIENTGKWRNNNIWYTPEKSPEFEGRAMGIGVDGENLYINIFRRRE